MHIDTLASCAGLLLFLLNCFAPVGPSGISLTVTGHLAGGQNSLFCTLQTYHNMSRFSLFALHKGGNFLIISFKSG